jgi:transposase InsO family protein
MMAAVMGVKAKSLKRWDFRQGTGSAGPAPKRGRPEAISLEIQMKIRTQYLARYQQWGPQVLADWVWRQGWGRYSAGTIARIIDDLQPTPEPKEPPRRYAITAPQVMWSEDGTDFKDQRQKKEFLILQDECARYKVNTRLVDGPATSEDVHAYLKEAFETHGPPLVLKHDGGSIFHEEAVETLLEEHQVISLTSPPYYPKFNGKMERTVRDIKGYERAMRPCNPNLSLKERLEETVRDLNDERPRPMLGGRTAKEVYEQDRIPLMERERFYAEVLRLEQTLLADAASRMQQRQARQHAVELVLLQYRYMKEITGVSTYSRAKRATS